MVPASQNNTLRNRAINAGWWTIAGAGFSQVFRFGTNLILTRLLAPEMFGVMALATIVLVAMTMLSDVGLKQSIVQSSRGDDAAFLSTAWVVQILRGFILALMALVLGSTLYVLSRLGLSDSHTAYANPLLAPVVCALAATLAISGFESTKLLQANRKLVMANIVLLELASQIVGLFVTLLWLAVDRSIWSLVAGAMCTSLTRTVASHVWMPGIQDKWKIDKSAFRELLTLGKWLFFGSVIGFFTNNVDRLLLGVLVNASTLGVYTLAFGICNVVEQLLMRVISDVCYPALGEVARERPGSVRNTYYRFYLVVALPAYFLAGVLFTLGDWLISVLYDDRYRAAGWMVQFLAIMLVGVPFRLSTYLLLAMGKPSILASVAAARLCGQMVLIPLLFHNYGLTGAISGIVIGSVVWIPITVAQQHKLGLFDWIIEVALLPIFALGLGAGILAERLGGLFVARY